MWEDKRLDTYCTSTISSRSGYPGKYNIRKFFSAKICVNLRIVIFHKFPDPPQAYVTQCWHMTSYDLYDLHMSFVIWQRFMTYDFVISILILAGIIIFGQHYKFGLNL